MDERRDDTAGTAGGERVRRFDSLELFGPVREIEIRHGDSVYRLRITRQGKLILNK